MLWKIGRRKTLTIFLLSQLLLMAFSVEAVVAQDPSGSRIFLPIVTTISPALPLETVSSIQSVSIKSKYLEDDNSTARVYFRHASEDNWHEGPAMSQDVAAKEWRVSLVNLQPNSEYSIQVRYESSENNRGAVTETVVSTKPDYPEMGTNGTIRTVPTDGSLSEVLDRAEPGDTIQLQAGVYHQALTLNGSHSGRAGEYITIEPAPNATVIFDGSDPSINSPEDDWTFYADSGQGQIYYIDLPWGDTNCSGNSIVPGYVGELIGQDGFRYLLFDSVSSNWDQDFLPAPAGKAFYVCNNSGPGPTQRLYVVTRSGDDPDNHQMHVARHSQAFYLLNTDYLRIRGLEFRYYGHGGIILSYDTKDGADHDIIESNTFHGIGRWHVKMEGSSSSNRQPAYNLVQNNRFYERGYRESGWVWEVSYRRGHGSVIGILLNEAGSGNVLRGNNFSSGHDSIAINNGTNDADVYNNTITECMDNGIEIDNNPGQNIRVWNNNISYCYSAISLQDWNGSNHGPAYVFRNVLIGGEDPQKRLDHVGGDQGYAAATIIKMGSDKLPDGWVYIYHNTVSMRRDTAFGAGIKDSGGDYLANVVTRNNIWSVTGRVFYFRKPTSIQNHDFDCDNLHDLSPTNDKFIEWGNSGGPLGNGKYRNLTEFQNIVQQEVRGISDASTLFDSSSMHLLAGSPDIDAGCVTPGFNDTGPNAYLGGAPDMGAFEYSP